MNSLRKIIRQKKLGVSMRPDKKKLKQGKNSYSFTDTFPPTLLLMGQKREKGEVIHHCDSRNHTSSLQKSSKTREIEGKIRLFRIQVDTICAKNSKLFNFLNFQKSTVINRAKFDFSKLDIQENLHLKMQSFLFRPKFTLFDPSTIQIFSN